MDIKNRTENHQRIESVEEILKKLSTLLSPVENSIIDTLDRIEKPIFLIIGCARSGTTLINQFLCDTKEFCFPSNLISRFFYAPYIGSLYQKILIDYDTKNEIFNSSNSADYQYSSTLGKTKGAHSPNEFWYFWRRFFKFEEICKLSNDELQNVNIKGFNNELNSIQVVFEKPLLMKGMLLNWHIDFLEKINDKINFIYVKRNIIDNAISLLNARKNFYNDINLWYSFKPEEYYQIKNKLPYQQVIDQVYYTNKAIEEQIKNIPKNKVIEIDYENFCQKPQILLDKIVAKQGINFSPTNKVFNRLNVDEDKTIIEKMKSYLKSEYDL